MACRVVVRSVELRRAISTDEPFLREMTYQALYTPPGSAPFRREIVDEPHIRKYHAGFGTHSADIGVIAQVTTTAIGACWCRQFRSAEPGYGWVDDTIPEMSIALVPDARGLGVGTTMINEIERALRDQGCTAVSLSVDARSPARRLYERLGFVPLGSAEGSVTMLHRIS